MIGLANPFRGILSSLLNSGSGGLPGLQPPGGFSGLDSDMLRPDARATRPPTAAAGLPSAPKGQPKVPNTGGSIEAYIRQAAQARGIDPDTAVRVARSEGGIQKWNRQSDVVRNGKREESYGPFQLYMGGGLGNRFQKATGLHPSDPAAGKAAIDFALDEVARDGWRQWYGAAKVGVGRWDGVNGAKALGQYASADRALAADGDGRMLGGEMADRRRGEQVTPYQPDQMLAMGLPDQMPPPGTQKLPGSDTRQASGGGGTQLQTATSSSLRAPVQHPVAKAVEAWKVNKTTRLLRGLSPAATIAALTAIGQDIRALREQEQMNARD